MVTLAHHTLADTGRQVRALIVSVSALVRSAEELLVAGFYQYHTGSLAAKP